METFYLIQGPISPDGVTQTRKVSAVSEKEAGDIAYRWLRQLEQDFYPDRPVSVIVARLVEIKEIR